MNNKIFLVPLCMILMQAMHAQSLPLIPLPVKVEIMKGECILPASFSIGYTDPGALPVAERFAERLRIPTGWEIPVLKGRNVFLFLNLLKENDSRLGKEGYTLSASSMGITISANQPAGLFYGTQTLIQLLPSAIEANAKQAVKWTIPAVEILDYPRFSWRGIMLDVSRNFFTKEEVKAYIDQLSHFKINTFHWHLTDDEGWRIEIKSLPKLTEVGAWRVKRVGRWGEREAPKPGEIATEGGFYTQEDIREIVHYARQRFITIVPEIDVPGHSMAAVASYPELSCTQDPSITVNPGATFAEWYGDGTFKMLIDNTLNPSNEKVYEFLDKVFTELAGLFPGEYIHVGGDECYKGYWEKDPGCQALMQKMNMKHVGELQGYFLSRVEKIIRSKGKKVIGWDEILEGELPPGTAVMSWRGMKGGIEAAMKGHPVVMTPSPFTYLDYYQGDPTVDPPVYAGLRVSKCYLYEPVPEGVDEKWILGGQGNLWTERVYTFRHIEYMSYPRAWALSEVYWSPRDARNWNDFSQRMELFFERSDKARKNYSTSVYDAIVKCWKKEGKLFLELGSELNNVDIYYSLEEEMPGMYTQKYSTPIEIPEGPVTVRIITYRSGKPLGKMISLKREQLLERCIP